MSVDVDLISLMTAVYKDAVRHEQLEKLQKALCELRQSDAESRRQKMDADIRAMAKLRISLDKFRRSYNKTRDIAKKDVPAVEDYIKSIENHIEDISYRKNHGK